MTAWNADPSIVLGIVGLATVYLLAASRWRRRLGGPAEPDRPRLLLFLAGMLVLVFALLSPLDRIADNELFSVHTVQHLLLTLVLPPLLLAGTPGWMLRPLLRWPGVLAAARAITRPVPAYLLFNVVFALSHVPVVFNLFQSSETLHAFEHLVYIGTAVIMWWPVLSPLHEVPRIPYPAQMLYLFLQTIVGGVAVGSLITLSGRPLYDKYAHAAGLWGLTPLFDQQAGGLIMWVGGGMYYLGALAVVFFRWAAQDAAATRPAAPGSAQRPAGSRH